MGVEELYIYKSSISFSFFHFCIIYFSELG